MPERLGAPVSQDDRGEAATGEKYCDSADTLRRLATRLHFDASRRSQLLALADEFERLADHVEGLSPLTLGERPKEDCAGRAIIPG